MSHTAHPHEEPQGEALIDAARDALIATGEQWTPMRAAVFETMAAFSKPASAYDIADTLSRNQERRIAANSVYRILDLFVSKNLAQRIESKNAFIVNAHPGCQHDCIFLVCDTCGNVDHLDSETISKGLRGAAQKASFVTSRPVIEVRGVCYRCHDTTN
jgi:Fur family zinc uptake transcriptional regulator